MTSFGLGCAVSGTAMAAAGRETDGEGESGPARPSSGSIRGRDADSHAVGAAGVTGRRQMPGLPGPIRRDCPLRANKQMVYNAYTPAMVGDKWRFSTGSDPKNVPYSDHNCGNWPVLVWPFVAAAVRVGRVELAEQALDTVNKRWAADNWPEYHDGRHGDLIGRRANFFQVWSATGLIIAHEVMENPDSRSLLDRALINRLTEDDR